MRKIGFSSLPLVLRLFRYTSVPVISLSLQQVLLEKIEQVKPRLKIPLTNI